MKTITVKLLVRHGACADQVRLFKRTFPHGASLTEASVRCALIAGLSVTWLANLLPAPAWAEYERIRASAGADYERIRAPAWAEYERIRASAWAEYERIKAPAWAEYERIRAPALAEYERIKAPAWAEYERTWVSALVPLLRELGDDA